MAGDAQQSTEIQDEFVLEPEDTEDFAEYEKLMGGSQAQNNVFGYNESTEVEAKDTGEGDGEKEKTKRKRDAQGRFTKGEDDVQDGQSSKDAGTGGDETGDNQGDGSSQTDTLDTMGKFKKRFDRERKKREALNKKIADLEKQNAELKKGKPDEPGDDDQQTQTQAKEPPVEPKREDYEEEEQYMDDMIDYWDAVAEFEDAEDKEEDNAGNAQEAEDGEKEDGQKAVEKDGGEQEELQQKDDKETPLNSQSDAAGTLWDDLVEILDEVEGEGISDNLVDDLQKGLNEGKIFISDQMAEWMIDNEDEAGVVIQEFIERPRQSRRIARAVGLKQEQMLQELVDNLTATEDSDVQQQFPNLSDTRGRGRRPAQDHTDSDNYAEYERQERERDSGSAWGWN